MEPTESNGRDARITLAEAARIVPGNPHTSAVWRWARRGVKARSGQRVRLEHIRVGGRVFTTQAWIDAFGAQLAAADTAYFDAKSEAAQALPPRDPKYGPPDRKSRSRPTAALSAAEQRRRAQIEEELDREGL